jgi:NACHT domain
VVFVADALGAWLVGQLADAGRRKLTTLVLGTDQERALRSAAIAAVQRTASELCPGDHEQASQMAMVVSQVFSAPVPGLRLAGEATVLGALQAGITGQLGVLDDPAATGIGQSSSDMLGVPGTVLAASLTYHLLQELVSRGSRGGPLEPLANQLSHDKTYLQGQRIEDKVMEVLARLDDTQAVAAAQTALGQSSVAAVGSAQEMTYLSAFVQRLAEVPSFLRPHSSRSVLHVRRSLTRRRAFAHAPWDPTIAVGDIVGTFRLLDAFNPRAQGRLRIVVTGGAGEGKTWWLESVASGLARRRALTGLQADPLPVLVRATDVLARDPGRAGVRPAIIESLLSDCGLADDAAVRSWLDEAWELQRLVVCLDGADEAGSIRRAELARVLRSLDRSGHFALVTSRPWFASEVVVRGTVVCRLEPLGYDARRELIERLGFAPEVGERMAFGGDLEREVVTPLHLALAWQVSRSGGRAEGHDLPVRMLEAYLGKPWRNDRSDDRGVIAAKMRVLGRVAAKAAHPRWSERIELRAYFAAIDRDEDRALAQGADPRSLGEQLLDRLDAVLETIEDESGEAVRFSHRPFHEGLVAHWLAQTSQAHRVRVLDEHEHDGSWTEITRNVLVKASPAELDLLLGGAAPISRARLRAAAEAARTSEQVVQAIRRVASGTTAALEFSPAASDRQLAHFLRSALRDPHLEWEHLAADPRAPSPKFLVDILGVDGVLDAVAQDERSHALIVRTLQDWDGELSAGPDHSPDAIRTGLKLAIHRRLMFGAYEHLLDMHKKLHGHNDWASQETELAAAEIDRRLEMLGDQDMPPPVVVAAVLSTLDLMVARDADVRRLVDRIAEVTAANDPIRNKILEETPFWKCLPTLVRSRSVDHLALLAFACARDALERDYSPTEEFDDLVKALERVLKGQPNYPTPYERLQGLTDRSRTAFDPRPPEKPFEISLHDLSGFIDPFDTANAAAAHIRERTADIISSLDYAQMPAPADLLNRLVAAVDREDDAYKLHDYPPELVAFFVDHILEIQHATPPACGVLLDLIQTAAPHTVDREVRRQLEAAVLRAGVEERKRCVGSWPLRLQT